MIVKSEQVPGFESLVDAEDHQKGRGVLGFLFDLYTPGGTYDQIQAFIFGPDQEGGYGEKVSSLVNSRKEVLRVAAKVNAGIVVCREVISLESKRQILRRYQLLLPSQENVYNAEFSQYGAAGIKVGVAACIHPNKDIAMPSTASFRHGIDRVVTDLSQTAIGYLL